MGRAAAIPRVSPRRASLLAVTSEMPWPLDSGGHLRTFHLLKALARNFDVRLITAAGEDEGGVAALQQAGVDVRAVTIPTRLWPREAWRAMASAAAREPYVLYRRHDQRAVRDALRRELETHPPSLIYLDHLDSLVFASEAPGIPIVADLHNIYSSLLARTAQESSRGLKRLYLAREARLLHAMESRAAKLATTLLATSQSDCDHFSTLGANSVYLVPNGVDCRAYESLPQGRRNADPLLLYVGTMSWEPNARAAVFLAETILPKVREQFPNCRLRIVGRDPSADVLALGHRPGVEVAGRVSEMGSHLAEAALLAVPLEAGGGTRLKILEAFAAGLPVVSTPIGCEGIAATDGEHLVVADRARFADAVCQSLRDPAGLAKLAANARVLALERYDWNAVGQVASSAIAQAIGRR
jgi:glycosyltransferase involved in cell wall biosynthesis